MAKMHVYITVTLTVFSRFYCFVKRNEGTCIHYIHNTNDYGLPRFTPAAFACLTALQNHHFLMDHYYEASDKSRDREDNAF